VLETIRADKDATFAKTPIIIMSNLWSNKDILRTKSLQVQAYMVKAYFTTEEILKKINEILSNQQDLGHHGRGSSLAVSAGYGYHFLSG
jgi:DNA-binding response OmpR family regulator